MTKHPVLKLAFLFGQIIGFLHRRAHAQGRSWTNIIPVDVQAVPEPDNLREDIPTIPEWGMILLGVLLVLLASKSLPRQAIGCVAAAGLAAFVPKIKAEI